MKGTTQTTQMNTDFDEMRNNMYKFELKNYDDSIKLNKKFRIFQASMTLFSLFFLIFNIMNNTYEWSFYVWVFNFVFNGAMYFRSNKIITEHKSKRLELLKTYDEKEWLREIRLKKFTRITKHFY